MAIASAMHSAFALALALRVYLWRATGQFVAGSAVPVLTGTVHVRTCAHMC